MLGFGFSSQAVYKRLMSSIRLWIPTNFLKMDRMGKSQVLTEKLCALMVLTFES